MHQEMKQLQIYFSFNARYSHQKTTAAVPVETAAVSASPSTNTDAHCCDSS